MPFKSDAQRKYMNWAAGQGKIKQSTVDEFNKASKGLKLPQTVNSTPPVPEQAKSVGIAAPHDPLEPQKNRFMMLKNRLKGM